jgi:four helix bundle protein
VFRFEGLEIYNDSIEYIDKVYRIADGRFPLHEKYILTQQAIRAVNSIALNIAEGSSRGNKDFNRFLGIAIGSLFETVTCFKIALKRKYITEEKYKEIYDEAEKLAKKINSFRKTLQ